MDDTQATNERWDLISRPGDTAPRQSTTDMLLGLNGPRYQLWPERLARGIVSGVVSGATLPGDAIEYERERARELRRTGRVTMSDSDTGPVTIGRLLDLATLGMPVNPGARSGDMVIAGEKWLSATPGTTPVPTRHALREAAEGERLAAADNPAAWDLHMQKAAGNDTAAARSRGIAKEFHEASTAANPGKAIQDKASGLLLDEDFLRLLTRDEIMQLQRIADGTGPGRLSSRIAKMFGAGDSDLIKAETALGSGLGTAAGHAAGDTIGAIVGGAIGGSVPTIVGRSFQGLHNASGRRQLGILEEMPLKDSPRYGDMLKSAPRGSTVNDLYRRGFLQVPLGAGGVARGMPRDDDR